MAGLADLLEAYKNYQGVQQWNLGQQMNRVPGAEEAMDLWGGFDTGGLAGAIKTYHGTPRAEPFTKFSKEFMGSTSGTAFGRGHYFAEEPRVAKSYSELKGPMFPGTLHIEGASKPTLDLLNSFTKFYPESDPKDLLNLAKHKASTDLKYAETPEEAETLKRIWEELSAGPVSRDRSRPAHSLYEVSLEWPDPAKESADPLSREHMFQWNKAFAHQPEHVKQALLDVADTNPESYQQYLERMASMHSGSDTYDPKQFMIMRPELAVREGGLESLLNERGVPGVAFRDQVSFRKPVAEKSYNYAIFDNEIPRILSHNKPSVLDLIWPKK